MKYINSFNSIEDYITYKENNTENLPGVNRIIEDNILTTNEDYPNSFVFIDDENNTNYNIIKYNSGASDVEFNNIDIIAKKQLNPTELLAEDSVLITKKYKWNELKTIPSGFVSGGNELNKICYLPDTVEVIEKYAFDGCGGLTSIKLPKKLKTIENYAFANCECINELIFTSKQCPDIDTKNLFGFDCYPNITNLVLPCPYLNNYTNLINDVKVLSEHSGNYETTINGTNINIISPINIDTTGNDNIVLNIDVIDKNGSVNVFDPKGGKYGINLDMAFNKTGVIDNLTNEECPEFIYIYNSNPFQIPANTTEDKIYAINVTCLGKTVTKYITQETSIQNIIVETPSAYTGFNYVEIQEHATGDYVDDETGEPFVESYVLFSSKNQNKHNSYSGMKIKINGFESFKLYIRSYAESNYDYIMVSQLDTNINNNTSYSNTTLVKAHTRGNPKNGTTIDNYTLVEFTNIDANTEHYITVVFRKDGSANSYDDTGYVLIPNINLQTVLIPTIELTYLNGTFGWNDDGDLELSDGNIYRRFTSSNQGYDNTMCRMHIDISNLDTFGFYIGSSSECNYDFVGVRFNNNILYEDIINNYEGTYSSWDAYDYWYATSVDFGNINPSEISEYNYIEFTGLNKESHFIEIAYVKDGGDADYTDSGFIAIPKDYAIITNIISAWNDCYTDGIIDCDCDSCDCDGCDYCDSCDCDSCDYCDSCDCDSCDYCDSCDGECGCDICDYCDSCDGECGCDICDTCDSCDCDGCDYCDSCDEECTCEGECMWENICDCEGECGCEEECDCEGECDCEEEWEECDMDGCSCDTECGCEEDY